MTQVLTGVDLGGTSIKAALADADGEVLATRSIPTESQQGPETVVARIGSLVGELCQDIVDAELQALGVGIPGLVDIDTGTTKFLPNFPTQWLNVPVARMLGDQLGCPVRLLNDVRTATLGELRFGHGRSDAKLTMAFFAIGTGVGGGVTIDGELRLGPLGAAGELGHQTILPNGPRCGCGNHGCLETLASGPAIAAQGVRLMRSGLAPALHELVKGAADRVTTREMSQVADQDSHVREVIVDAARAIGMAAANVVTILHPDIIVLGGGVAEIGPLLTDTVRDEIRERVGMFPTENVRVETSRLGEQAGTMGAVALAKSALVQSAHD